LSLLVQAYSLQEHHLLAEFTIRQFIESSATEARLNSVTGYSLLVHALLRQDRRNAAYRVVADHPDILERDQRFWRSTIGMLRNLTGEPTANFISAIDRGHNRYCRGTLDRQSRLDCWQAEAWLADQRGSVQEAEWVYERLYEQMGQPKLLMNFYSRHFRCKKMEALMRDWRKDHAGGSAADSRFERMIRSCRQKLR
jgi:hypothetical protein